MIAHPRRNRRATITSTVTDTNTTDPQHDPEWESFLTALHDVFEPVNIARMPLFRTDVDTSRMWQSFLDSLPPESRQIHVCWACRKFVEHYGGLVTIDPETGKLTSALWHPGTVPPLYVKSVFAMRSHLDKARVTGVFLHKEHTLGQYATNGWKHMHVRLKHVYVHATLTPGQAEAMKRTDFQTVSRALADFSPSLMLQAEKLLKADALTRSERFLGPVQWLINIHERHRNYSGARNARTRENITWAAVATAPPGFCHPRSGVIGSLLEDIASGLSFTEVKRRWTDKLHPLRYQRPQAAPAAGTVTKAEKLVEQLGIARSLERRFARLDEVLPYALWTPKRASERPAATTSTIGSVFSDLPTKTPRAGAHDTSTPDLNMPPKPITWVKFEATVLPYTARLAVRIPTRGAFYAITTAMHADAPPILQWDNEDNRNPFCQYTYHGGSFADQWHLHPGTRLLVPGIIETPARWTVKAESDPVLLIEGAYDLRTDQGNALFPETLRAELHGVRSVIEAYSRKAVLGQSQGVHAAGLRVLGAILYAYDTRGLSTAWTVDRLD